MTQSLGSGGGGSDGQVDWDDTDGDGVTELKTNHTDHGGGDLRGVGKGTMSEAEVKSLTDASSGNSYDVDNLASGSGGLADASSIEVVTSTSEFDNALNSVGTIIVSSSIDLGTTTRTITKYDTTITSLGETSHNQLIGTVDNGALIEVDAGAVDIDSIYIENDGTDGKGIKQIGGNTLMVQNSKIRANLKAIEVSSGFGFRAHNVYVNSVGGDAPAGSVGIEVNAQDGKATVIKCNEWETGIKMTGSGNRISGVRLSGQDSNNTTAVHISGGNSHVSQVYSVTSGQYDVGVEVGADNVSVVNNYGLFANTNAVKITRSSSGSRKDIIITGNNMVAQGTSPGRAVEYGSNVTGFTGDIAIENNSRSGWSSPGLITKDSGELQLSLPGAASDGTWDTKVNNSQVVNFNGEFPNPPAVFLEGAFPGIKFEPDSITETDFTAFAFNYSTTDRSNEANLVKWTAHLD